MLQITPIWTSPHIYLSHGAVYSTHRLQCGHRKLKIHTISFGGFYRWRKSDRKKKKTTLCHAPLDPMSWVDISPISITLNGRTTAFCHVYEVLQEHFWGQAAIKAICKAQSETFYRLNVPKQKKHSKPQKWHKSTFYIMHQGGHLLINVSQFNPTDMKHQSK